MAAAKKGKGKGAGKGKGKGKSQAKTKPPGKKQPKPVFNHLTGDDLGEIVRVDVGLAIKVGELQSVKTMEKLIEEIKTCWLHLGMKKELAVFQKIMDSGVAEANAYQKKWFE